MKMGSKKKNYFWTAHGEIAPNMDMNFQNFTNEEAFQKKSGKAKGVRASEKGSSLHNEGLVTTRTPRRRLVTYLIYLSYFFFTIVMNF